MSTMTMRHIITLAALAFLLLTGCSSVRVSQDYDTSYAFGDVHTFGWNLPLQVWNGESPGNNELLDRRFKKAIELALKQKGFQLDEHPSLLVSYAYTVTSRITSTPVTTGFRFGTGRYGRYGGIDTYNSNSIEEYDQGKLEISLHSAATDKLIWLGRGTRRVYDHSTPERITQAVNETVQTILNQFPPGSIR